MSPRDSDTQSSDAIYWTTSRGESFYYPKCAGLRHYYYYYYLSCYFPFVISFIAITVIKTNAVHAAGSEGMADVAERKIYT